MVKSLEILEEYLIKFEDISHEVFARDSFTLNHHDFNQLRKDLNALHEEVEEYQDLFVNFKDLIKSIMGDAESIVNDIEEFESEDVIPPIPYKSNNV